MWTVANLQSVYSQQAATFELITIYKRFNSLAGPLDQTSFATNRTCKGTSHRAKHTFSPTCSTHAWADVSPGDKKSNSVGAVVT